jgi:hypothetical protein
MHKLQLPAVTRPGAVSNVRQIPSKQHIPQITLVLPPDVKLIDRLAERAVQDYGSLVEAA